MSITKLSSVLYKKHQQAKRQIEEYHISIVFNAGENFDLAKEHLLQSHAKHRHISHIILPGFKPLWAKPQKFKGLWHLAEQKTLC